MAELKSAGTRQMVRSNAPKVSPNRRYRHGGVMDHRFGDVSDEQAVCE
jgi:hypothetical protein